MIMALLRTEKNKCDNVHFEGIFEELLSKMYSLSILQSELYMTDNYSTMNFGTFLKTIIENLKDGETIHGFLARNYNLKTIGIVATTMSLIGYGGAILSELVVANSVLQNFRLQSSKVLLYRLLSNP